MTPYLLLFLLWQASGSESHFISVAEFTSKDHCEFAAQEATKKFQGWGARAYYICVPK